VFQGNRDDVFSSFSPTKLIRAMHIEWKRDPVPGRDDCRRYCLAVFLVADPGNGDRPGLEPKTLLSSVEERFLNAGIRDMREFYRGLFWSGIDNSLDRLQLEPGERIAVETEISQKVSRPGDQWALWGVTCNSRFD
jgi:hypothetical protein